MLPINVVFVLVFYIPCIARTSGDTMSHTSHSKSKLDLSTLNYTLQALFWVTLFCRFNSILWWTLRSKQVNIDEDWNLSFLIACVRNKDTNVFCDGGYHLKSLINDMDTNSDSINTTLLMKNCISWISFSTRSLLRLKENEA